MSKFIYQPAPRKSGHAANSGQLPASPSFTELLLRANPWLRKVFREWRHYEGMHFGEWRKWWGTTPGLRPTAHEGLDLLFYTEKSGTEGRLKSATRIPDIYPGKVAGIIQDFLSRTIIIATTRQEIEPFRLVVFYAHLVPIGGLQVGDELTAGTTLGHLPEPLPSPAAIPPHLHLSLALVHRDLELARFSWPDFRPGEKFHPCDPYEIM